VDVYALGLVLLEALTGTRPFTGTSVEMALARLSHAPEIPAALPGPWRALLLAMTARAPQDRPTATEVLARLRGDSVPPVVRVPRGVSPRVALSGTAVAFALLLGAAAWTSLPVPSGAASAASAHHAHLTPAPQPTAAAPEAPSFVPATAGVDPPPPVSRVSTHHGRHHHARQHRPDPRHHYRGHHRHVKHHHHDGKHHHH
jgi:serine/threonine protein kinase